MAKEWLIPPLSPASEDLASRWRIPRLLAQILLNRGIDDSESKEAFLSPQLKDLVAPDLLPGAVEAAGAIVEAVRAKRKIVIYGDYDVDGTTGLAILWHAIRAAGGDPGFYVPHRVDEGYGLNRQAVPSERSSYTVTMT